MINVIFYFYMSIKFYQMAIKSYLAHPNRGQKEKFINELSALKNCNGGTIAAQINIIMLISELFIQIT